MLHPAALLTREEARAADKAAIEGGIPSARLMENAAKAVADVICKHYTPRPCLIICGAGNNGGDGMIVARMLKERGWPVHAVNMADFRQEMIPGTQLIVDAIFGTGLSRPVDGVAKNVIDAINRQGAPVVSIDIASGIDADSGQIMGAAVRATHTVTFVRPKLGQMLLPGKAHTGTLHTANIGITGESIQPRHALNIPLLWQDTFPSIVIDGHKYQRGHTVVMGGPVASTGASRLAALAALRVGSGLVSVACIKESLPVYAATLTSVMTRPVDGLRELDSLLEDARVTSTIIGPGYGVSEKTCEHVLQILSCKKACVLDADALTAFKNHAKSLFSAIHGPTVMTPHEGEFARIFTIEGDKAKRAREAANQSGAVVVLKGNDTVIAAPDGRVAVNIGAPVWLATAGSGDVLSGIIGGLLAQGMNAFEAACAGVWIHSRAAVLFGVGMIAEDMPGHIPAVLKELYSNP